MSEQEPKLVLTSIGHDPEGKWQEYLPKVAQSLDPLYDPKVIIFTKRTNPKTIEAAGNSGWNVLIEDNPINHARIRALEVGYLASETAVNLWEADRLINAAIKSPEELKQLACLIPQYDFFVAGASPEAIATHSSSMTFWEEEKSRVLGNYLGVEGDIGSRGCFGFSRDFLRWFLTIYKTVVPTDETDAVFPMMALVYEKLLKEHGLEGKSSLKTDGPAKINRGIGYGEFQKITSSENLMFKADIKTGSLEYWEDFEYRGEHVLNCIQTADRIAALYGLTPKLSTGSQSDKIH